MTPSVPEWKPSETVQKLHNAERHHWIDMSEKATAELQRLSTLCAPDLATAYERFVRHRRSDPLTDVQCGLLSGAAVCDYVATTGMLFDCALNTKTVKLASIDFQLLGKIVYFDKDDRVTRELAEGEEFILPRNSIAFVTLRPYIQLPDYIAIRFNLRITNIYRGLLLGTGPLVDPGFQGRLSFPLHNLTNNPYRFRGGEAIITAEFTKLEQPPVESIAVDGEHGVGAELSAETVPVTAGLAKSKAAVHQGSTLRVPFPEPDLIHPSSDGRSVDDYLAKTKAPGPIVSSLAPLRRNVDKFRTEFRAFQIFGAVSLLFALMAVTTSVYNATTHANQFVEEARKATQADRESQQLQLAQLRAEQSRMRLELRALEDSLRRLPARSVKSTVAVPPTRAP